MLKIKGNTLIIILILTIIIGLISLRIFNASSLIFKSSIQHKKNTTSFIKTENCLNEYIDKILTSQIILPEQENCKNEFCVNFFNPNFQLNSQSKQWWENHAINCNTDTWIYIELFAVIKSKDEYSYRISAYNNRHILLQVIVTKNWAKNVITDCAWHQIY